MPIMMPSGAEIIGDQSKKTVVRLFNRAYHNQTKLVWAMLAALVVGGCNFGVGAKHLPTTAQTSDAASPTREEKHRLYSAALAASDAPLDTELFKTTCKKIGIFDNDGNPNPNYMEFVQEHIGWGMRTESNQFRSEINTKERAHQYVLQHLP